ncbi:hypothetical protein ISCGN_027977, partial [Ixodes scapularis]
HTLERRIPPIMARRGVARACRLSYFSSPATDYNAIFPSTATDSRKMSTTDTQRRKLEVRLTPGAEFLPIPRFIWWAILKAEFGTTQKRFMLGSSEQQMLARVCTRKNI